MGTPYANYPIGKRTQYPSQVLRPFCVLDMEFLSWINDKNRIMEYAARQYFFWYTDNRIVSISII